MAIYGCGGFGGSAGIGDIEQAGDRCGCETVFVVVAGSN